MAKKFTILRDSREKTGWNFRASANCNGMEIRKLKTGDYSLKGYEHLVMIERKSIPDLWCTFLQRREVFLKEIARASEYPIKYLIIEGSYKDIAAGFRYSKVNPDVILAMLISLEIRYDIHVVFLDKRSDVSQEYVRKLLAKLFRYCEEGVIK